MIYDLKITNIKYQDLISQVAQPVIHSLTIMCISIVSDFLYELLLRGWVVSVALKSCPIPSSCQISMNCFYIKIYQLSGGCLERGFQVVLNSIMQILSVNFFIGAS